MSLIVMALTLSAILASFTLSASAGLGGSLILVPALALVLGTKEGVALAALLLAGNTTSSRSSRIAKRFHIKRRSPSWSCSFVAQCSARNCSWRLRRGWSQLP